MERKIDFRSKKKAPHPMARGFSWGGIRRSKYDDAGV